LGQYKRLYMRTEAYISFVFNKCFFCHKDKFEDKWFSNLVSFRMMYKFYNSKLFFIFILD